MLRYVTEKHKYGPVVGLDEKSEDHQDLLSVESQVWKHYTTFKQKL